MVATRDCLPGLRLVDVEAGDPARREKVRDLGVEPLGERLRSSTAARLGDPMGDLLRIEDGVPGRLDRQVPSTTRATASAYRRRGCAP